MKAILNLLIGIILFSIHSFSQNIEDQNPNFKRSLDKYEAKKETSEMKQSTTQQSTYEVTDWREEREERRALKSERRHELRKMRIERDIHNRRMFNHNCNPYNRFDRFNRHNRYINPYYNF